MRKTQIIDTKRFSGSFGTLRTAVLLLFFAFFTSAAIASEHLGEETAHKTGEHHTEKEPIGAQLSEMILGHVSDNHSWDVFGHAVVLPLPVIVYNEIEGLKVFSSSKFGPHGHETFEGMKLVDYGAKIVWADGTRADKIWNFSITKNTLNLFLGSFLICILLIAVARKYAKNRGKAPSGFQNLVESLVVFLRDDIFKTSIGPKYRKFTPLLLTIFFFIFFMNLLGQIPFFPGGANVTGNVAVTGILALIVFIYVTVNGNKHYWKHIFMPDAPIGLWPMLIPIELFGVILKPIVLMLRLFANITAGHIIILGFFSLIFIFGGMQEWIGYAVSPASIGFGIFMSFMELLVAFLQAFVFTLLSALYIGMAVEEHEHHELENH